MINSKKKGFTIVELVIVIAVIAVLSAVLIPTFSNLVKKANLSADQQAVRQMNTALALEGVLGDDDIFSVYDALTEMGMTAKDYKPLTKDTFFFWDQNKKVILHVDNNKTVIAPEQYKGETFNAASDTWLSLSMSAMKTTAPEGYTESSNKVTVKTAEELAYVVESLNKQMKSIEIDLGGNTIDMMGANITIKDASYAIISIKNGTIKNTSAINPTYQGKGGEGNDTQYRVSGLFTKLDYSTVTIENVVFENINVKNTNAGNVSLLIAGVHNNSNVTIKDVTIKNSTVIGHRNVGSLVGLQNSGSLTIQGISLENVDVKTVGGRSGLIIGLSNAGSLSGDTIEIKNCNYELYKCDQNTGSFTDSAGKIWELGLTPGGMVYSICYNTSSKKYEIEQKYYIEKTLVMRSNTTSGNSIFTNVTGWN